MSRMVFRKPPLVEIAAEVRWNLPNVQGTPKQLAAVPIPVNPGAHEIQFMNFAAKAGAKGFSLVERVIPPGFPLFANNVAFRYRNPNAAVGAPLFQLGPGIFSINVVPPYKSWESFLPHIDQGLDLLFDSWPDQHKKQFSGVRLHYIDAFSDDLREGKSTLRFLAENLGIGISIPQSVTQFCTNVEAVRPNFSVSMPVARGTLELKVNEGWVRNIRSLVMQTSVSVTDSFPFEKAGIVDALDTAHTIIHESFVGMTKPLHQMMQPEEQD